MPKLKTKKAVAKRVKITKKKKILYTRAGRRHLLCVKTRQKKRAMRRKSHMPPGSRQSVRRSVPYAL